MIFVLITQVHLEKNTTPHLQLLIDLDTFIAHALHLEN